MSETYTQQFGHLVGEVRNLKDAAGDTFDAYSALTTKAMADGALDRKTKELIAMVAGITRLCEGCIISHARGAAKAGATREELAEAAGVAIMMNGGPGATYAAKAVAAFDEFAAAKK